MRRLRRRARPGGDPQVPHERPAVRKPRGGRRRHPGRVRDEADRWLKRLTEYGVPNGPINDVEDVVHYEQTTARDLVVEHHDPDWEEVFEKNHSGIHFLNTNFLSLPDGSAFMKAVVCHGFEDSEIVEIPRPSIKPNEVLIEVERVQLSVTECKLYQGDEIAHYDTVQARLQDGDARLFGHEFCGQIVDTGDAVSRLSSGDFVYAPGKISCYDCNYCLEGYPHLCAEKESIGYDRPGALAEYVALPVTPLSQLPKEVSPAEGAAMQPLASSLLCVIDAKIQPGDIVAVIGTGVMGYQCAQLAQVFGASRVFCVDVRELPLELAAAHGITPIYAPETDPIQRILDATDGIGADVVFEAVGGDQMHATSGHDPLSQAFQAVRIGGTITQIGHITGEISLTPRVARSKCVDWVNPRKGVVSLGPNMNTGELAPRFVADEVVSIAETVTQELNGLDSFEQAVDITMNKAEYNAFGPPQILIS